MYNIYNKKLYKIKKNYLCTKNKLISNGLFLR